MNYSPDKVPTHCQVLFSLRRQYAGGPFVMNTHSRFRKRLKHDMCLIFTERFFRFPRIHYVNHSHLALCAVRVPVVPEPVACLYFGHEAPLSPLSRKITANYAMIARVARSCRSQARGREIPK